jgi:hypothetical protein
MVWRSVSAPMGWRSLEGGAAEVTGNEPAPERPVDQPAGYDQYGQPGYPAYQPPGYDQYGQPGYPAYQPYPVYPTYQGYTGYPYPYPYPYPPPDTRVRGQAIASLVTNIVVSLMCCPLIGIAGIALSAIAMSRSERDPESARKLVIWSWCTFAVSVLAGVAMFVLLFLVAPAQSQG